MNVDEDTADIDSEAKRNIDKLVQETKSNAFYKLYDMKNSGDNVLNQGIETTRNSFRNIVYVSKLSDERNTLIFIGPSEEQCESAQSMFVALEKSNHSNAGRFRELSVHSFCKGKLLLRVLQGNIVHQDADAIVNAANKHLHDGGGVTGAIYEAGGDEFRRRCGEVMKERNYKPLDIGEVLETKACGSLLCQSVLHAVAPEFYKCKGLQECAEKMNLTCAMILIAADQMRFRSVGIPAMGTGIYGVPIEVFCDALLSGIKHLFDIKGTDSANCLEEIRLVNYDKYQAEDINACISESMKNYL